jgi:hypothetical protein
MKGIDNQITEVGISAAQWMVRRLPASRLREWVWRWGQWRSKEFVTKTTHDVSIAENT